MSGACLKNKWENEWHGVSRNVCSTILLYIIFDILVYRLTLMKSDIYRALARALSLIKPIPVHCTAVQCTGIGFIRDRARASAR